MIKTTYIKELTVDLIARLPELEWKAADLNPFLFSKSIPKNVFRTLDVTAAACINEIKADIQTLAKQDNYLSAYYLAGQVKQKISVLVGLCKIEKKNKQQKDAGFGISMLSTRQQWLQSLEQTVSILTKQQEALAKTLTQMQSHNTDVAVLLNIKSELGEAQRRLTLAKEALNKATT
jgi:hypothetical protein